MVSNVSGFTGQITANDHEVNHVMHVQGGSAGSYLPLATFGAHCRVTVHHAKF